MGLAYYVQNNRESLLKTVLQEEILGKNHAEDPKQVKKRKLKEKIDRWRAKPLHGQIIRQTEQINTQISTLVLRKMSAGYKLARIFSQDIKMSFGLDKCAVLEMRRGRQVGSSGIELPVYRGNRGERLQIPLHLTVGSDSQHQDERQDNIGVYQKSQEVVQIKTRWRKLNRWHQYLGCRCSTLQ